MHISFVRNYQGHNGGFFDRGPNWVQLTFPPSRKQRRCALIVTRHGVALDRNERRTVKCLMILFLPLVGIVAIGLWILS